MAKTSKSKDPAALAFSAVEEALKESVFDVNLDDITESAESVTVTPELSDRARVAEEIAGKTVASANDDTVSTSSLLYSLQSRPSGAPFVVALLAALAWIAGVGYITYTALPEIFAQFSTIKSFAVTPGFAGLVAILLVPVVGFFVLAFLIRRAQDLRIAATSMTQAALKLTEPETSATHKISSIGQAVRREVNAMSDGLERALSRASELEVMVHNEVTSLETQYSENETRLRQLVADLAEQREAVIANADSVRMAISGAHLSLSDELGSAGALISEQILDAGVSAISEMKTQGANVAATLLQASETFDQSIGEKSVQLTESLAVRQDEMSSSIEAANISLNKMLSDQSSYFTESMMQSQQQLSESLEARTSQITDHLNDSAEQLSAALSVTSAQMSNAMSSTSEKVTQDIEAKVNALSSILMSSGESILIDMSLRGQEVNARIDETGHEITREVTEKTAELADRLAFSVNRMGETLSIQGNQIDSRVQSAVLEISSAISEGTDQATTAFSDAGKNSLDSINSSIDAISVVLDTRMERLDAIIGDKGELVISSLDLNSQKFTDTAENLLLNLDDRSAEINTMMSDRSVEITNSLKATGQDVDLRLQSSLTMITNTMDERTKTVTDVISNRISDVNDNIGSVVDDAVAKIAGAEAGVAAKVEEVGVLMDKNAQKIVAVVDEKLGSLPDAIVARADITADRLTALNETIETSFAISIENINEGAEKLEETLTVRVRDITENLTGVTDRISMDFEQTTNRMDVVVRTALESLQATQHEIEDLVGIKAVATIDSIVATSAKLNDTVAEQTDILDARLSAHSLTLRAALEENSEIAENLMAQTNASIQENATVSLQKLNDSNLLLQRVLETSNTNLVDLGSSIAQQTSAYSEAIDRAVGQSKTLGENITDQSDSLHNSMDLLIEKNRGEYNQAMQKALTDSATLGQKTADDVQLVQNKMSAFIEQNAGEFAIAIDRAVTEAGSAGKMMGEHVISLQESMAGILSQISQTQGELHSQEVRFEVSAQALITAGATTNETLENRRVAIDSLVEGFTQRADEIDGRLRSFASQLAETITSTEDRILASQETMQKNIDTLSLSSQDQSQKVGMALRETQADMIAEMNTAMTQATTHFNETAESMRTTAIEMNNELEATRTELSRAVLDLPEETKSSAAAMRRVVSEQINALSQLNAIVRTQNAAHSVTPSRAAPVAQTAPIQPPAAVQPAAPAPAPVAPAPHRPSRLENDIESALAPAPVTPLDRLNKLLELQDGGVETLEPTPAPAPKAAAPAPAPVAAKPAPAATTASTATAPGTTRDSNWLRDVLRNASTEDAPKQAAPVNLANLTKEIASAFDSAALAQAWKQYRAGQEYVFTRRLYTLTGQGTFDNVRKKIQREPEFAKMANTYVSEFEQVLRDGAKNDTDGTLLQKYLNSERGKVYSMLAHALGRLN